MGIFHKDNNFSLDFKGMEIIRHDSEDSFVTVGLGSATYEMERGAFVIEESLEYKASMEIVSLEIQNNKYLLKMINKDRDICLDLQILEEEQRIRIEINNVKGNINRLWINLNALPNEHVYGCGETFTHFDLRGNNVRIWVAEHQNLKRLEKKFDEKRENASLEFNEYETYYAQPTFVSSRKYFVHVDSSAYMEFDFRNNNFHTLMIRDIPKSIIIGKNDTFEHLLSNLTELLGRQPQLPMWMYNGVILGLQGGTDIVLEKMEKALKKGMKIAGLWCQDWQGRRITTFGKQLMWNWECDKDLYSNLDNIIWDLKAKGIRFMGYINPFLAIEGKLYEEASAKGYTVKNSKGDDYLVTITTFPAAMVDLTNPSAFTWIKDVIKKNMIEFGLDGWMADYGEYLPVDAVLYSKEDGEKVHNTWPALWAKANREAVEEAGRLGEVVFFTRAGHTESVRYSTLMWAGDQHVDFSMDDGLASVIPASLSLAMCGHGLCHSDVGGYTTLYHLKRSKELFMRWAEHCAFTPVMRSHEGNRPDSNVQFDYDDETLTFYARMSNIYSKLAPYIKEVVKENALLGIPAMRPLFMYYEEEKAFTCAYQYLLGRDLLVAPVIKEKVSTWEVYLPNDEWIHLWSGKQFKGGDFRVDAPIGYPAVFYKKTSNYRELFETLK